MDHSLVSAAAGISEAGAALEGTVGNNEAMQKQSLAMEQHGCGPGQGYFQEAMGYGRAAPADPDAESLSMKISQHMQALTEDAVEHLMSVKLRMLASLEAAVANKQQVGASALATKQAEVDILKGELQGTQTQLSQAETFMDRLADRFARKHQAVQDTKSLLIAWFTWRQHIARQRRLARQWLRAERYYTQNWLLGRAWGRWAGSARTHYKQLAAQRAEQQRQAEVSALSVIQYQEVAGLQTEIEALQQQLQQEAEARNRMEEEMKRAFMRGVTAINLEAVQIMRRGAPPSGANPFPVTLPLNTSTAAAGLAAAVQQRHHQEHQLQQQEQQGGDNYIVTPAPAVSEVRSPPSVTAANAVMPGSTTQSAAAEEGWSPSRGTGSSSSRVVQAAHPVMRFTGGILPAGTANAAVGAEQAQMPEAAWGSSTPTVAIAPAMGNNLPKVIVERGPAVGTHSRLGNMHDGSSAGRVVGSATEINHGRASGIAASKGVSGGHSHSAANQRHR